jgi:C4-dicarboxylate transporter DctQ subunit
MENFANRINKVWEISTKISIAFLFILMILVVVNVVARRLFNAPIFGVTELVSYGSLAAASFGLAQTEWMDGNVRMTLILERVSAKTGCIINLIINIIGLFGFSYVSYFMVLQALEKLANGQLSSEIRFPMYIVTGILAIGFILLTIAILTKVILYVLRIKNKQYSIASPFVEAKSEEEVQN